MLVVGIVAYGLVKVLPGVELSLEAHGIRLIAEPTPGGGNRLSLD